MPLIGLIGGIGSGKSTVARLLAGMGCVVADSDAMGHAALRDPAIRDQIVRWWGPRILDARGQINRSAVAKIVFADPVQRKRLEGLTHPWIEARRRELFDAAPPGVPGAPGTRALVVDAPLLMEAGLDQACDAVIFVDAPRAQRLARVAAARGWSEADVARRESGQLPLDAKARRADHIVCNDGDLESLRAQVSRVLSTILQTRGS